MKTLTKLALAAVILATAISARAESVSGHFRSNGTYVAPYYRTPANGIPYDNLSYRGYPSQQPGYVSPRTYGYGSELSSPTRLPYWNDNSRHHGDYLTPLPFDGQPKRGSRYSELLGFDF